MARVTTESGAETIDQLKFQAEGAERIELPSAEFIADAKMTRDGNDLLLETPSGEVAVIEGYFAADPAPLLASPDGSVLTPNLVEAFARSPMEFAANEAASDESPIGAVEEVKGNATVTRTDGTVEAVAIGTPIYQGDVIETDAAGAVNIVFMDETSMAVSENARMAIDEYSYDPATESGTTNFSVLRGLFVFTSGLIGRDDPDDVKINTPVGSIGIRGTIIAGNINPDGESSITVLEGAIVVTNGEGNITLSQAFETVKLNGFNAPISEAMVMPAAEINARFAAVSAVNPTLFSTISDTVQEQQQIQQQPVPAPEAQPETRDSAPQSQSTTQSAPTVTAQDSATPSPPSVEAAPDTPLVDPSLSGFGSADMSLPTANVVAGQTSGGVFDTSSNSVPIAVSTTAATSPVTGGTAPITDPALGNTGNGTAGPASPTTSAADAVQTSPTVINNTNNPVPATPALAVNPISATDIVTSGTIIGTATVLNLNGDTYTAVLANDPSNYFTLTDDGLGNLQISLTTNGIAALGASLDLVNLGNVDIVVTPTTTGTALTQTLNVVVTDANASRIIDLDVNGGGVSTISDNINNRIGYSVSALGDVNNDGFDDFVFTNNVSTGSNHSYIVHGNAGGIPTQQVFDANLGIFGDPMDIVGNGTTGSNTGESVAAGVGDLDGDGIRDYVVGQNLLNGNGAVTFHSGSSPVFSQGSGSISSGLGISVAGAGDYNNDGFADVIVGAQNNGARLYFGVGGVMPTNGNASTLTATITDSVSAVTGLGDFNGDGYSDFAIATPGTNTGDGSVSIYYGGSTFTPGNSSVILGTVASGFGTFLSSIGDINGDGLSDMIVGNNANQGYIFLGGTNPTSAGGAASVIDIPTGYSIMNMGSAGDFNGDGYGDFTVSVADANDVKSYVVFGKNSISNIDANYLKNPANAFELQYDGANGSSQYFNVNNIGDVNGDGYDDLALGVPDANGGAAGNGGVIIVNGRSSGNTTTTPNASADGQNLVGNAANNTLDDQGYDNISMRGGAGNDVFLIADNQFRTLDGGGGDDTIVLKGLNNNLDFSAFNFEDITGIESLRFNDNNQTMTLTLENIFNLLKSSDDGILKIDSAVTGSILDIDAGTATGAGTNANIVAALNELGNGANDVGTGGGYNHFSIGGFDLYIDVDVAVNVV